MSEELLSVKQVSQVLKTNTAYVYRLRDSGLLKFMKLGTLKCRRSALDDFIRSMDGMDATDPLHIKPLDTEGDANEHN